MSEIAQVQDIQIQSIRSANQMQESVPPSSILCEATGLTRLVGVASTTLEFEESLMLLGDLRVDLTSSEELKAKGWELTGFNIKFEAYLPEHNIFVSKNLNESQILMRESLLGLRGEENLKTVCLPLIQIINREIHSDDEKVTQTVKTLSTLIVDPNLLRV